MLAAAERGCEPRFSIRVPDKDIAPELEAIAFKATARAPDDRFPTARELSDAVERYLDGDRDTERRRALAGDHAREAAEIAARRDLTIEDRRRAMHDVSRALALDPENADALGTLVRLLTELPAEMPKDALDEIHASRRATARSMARVALGCYLSFFFFVPFIFAMGNRSNATLAVLSAAWLCAGFAAYAALRKPHPEARISYVSLFAGSAAISLTSVLFGPYILVPMLATLHAAAFLMSPSRAGRAAIAVASTLAILAPAALDWAGVVAPFYAFTGDTITVLPHWVDFPPVATRLCLAAVSVTVVASTCVILARSRDALSRAEERVHLQAWQLRQLVPAAAQHAARTPPPPSARACM
jgi:hypothetical protein